MPRRVAPKCLPRGSEADWRDPNVAEQLIAGQTFYGPPILVTLHDWRKALEVWRESLIELKREHRSRLYVEKFLDITLPSGKDSES